VAVVKDGWDFFLEAGRERDESTRFFRGVGYGLLLSAACWAVLGFVVVVVVRLS
jgi:hypothetical protein